MNGETMTRDEILAMPAGREMDALITEKVMGGQVHRRSDGAPHYLTWTQYSTDMGVAWEVLEKMRDPNEDEPDFWVITDEGKSQGWTVSSYWAHHDGHIDNFHVHAETAPLAICRAALLAVMNL